MKCPICDILDYKMLFEIRNPEFGKEVSYQIYTCNVCNSMYVEGPKHDDIMLQIYDEKFYTSGQQYAPINENGDFTAESRRFPIVMNAIARTDFIKKLGANGSLLDIGAGRGYFVKAASKTFDAEGIELNPHAATFGTSMKVKITAGNFLTHDFGERPFSIITLWDVFAGLPEPHIAMRKIRSLLKQGGLLVMTLPDGGSLAARLLGRYWPLMVPPGNSIFYNSNSIRKLLTTHDFQIKSINYQTKWVSADFLFYKLAKTLGFRRLAQVNLPTHLDWQVPLNTKDIMTVVAVCGEAV